MAQRKKTNRRPADRSRRSPGRPRRQAPAKQRSLALLGRLRPLQPEFREDPNGTGLLKQMYVTRQQRLHMLRWGLYILVCVMALVLQDVIMSQVKLFGATTDLAPTAILLIAVMEGSEVGSVFAMLASIVYFFSGTAPGAYCVGFISVFGMLASLFRQQFLHRSTSSIIICAGIAIMAYELGLYGAGLFLGLTRWDRILRFVMCGVYNVLVMIPLYRLVHRIGLIGGNIWKE